ncbi:hypothetical protein HWV62_33461 [Athelia sp. TMB]|nr:hypothetical protein HWV62_42653 [Athelia sp. TMB]KAF7981447.1 hypothetical protein HWV62_33461 [Athelia sp. TMB]
MPLVDHQTEPAIPNFLTSDTPRQDDAGTISGPLNGTNGVNLADLSTPGPSSPKDRERKELENLKKQLLVENRVKDGAENLLVVPNLTEEMRQHVESELAMAKGKIDTIEQQVKSLNARTERKATAPLAPRRRPTGQGSSENAKPKEDSSDDKDDLRTSLNYASNCIKALLSAGGRPATSPASPASTSSISPAVSTADPDRTRIDIMKRLGGVLQRNMRVRYELNFAELIQSAMPALSDSSSKHCRATAYKLLRQALVDVDSAEILHDIDWFIVKSLTRDNKHAVEKEQVIKLIRAVVTVSRERKSIIGTGPVTVPISDCVMRALVAVADYPEDPFRSVCIQTLAEILLLDIDLVARTGGIRFLLHALGEGPLELGPILAATFLSIIDSPRTRSYLTVGTDLEIALSAITDAYGKGPEHSERMRGCARVIHLMLRTWSGAFLLLWETETPDLQTFKEIILDMFFDLLNIKTPEWFQTFIDGRRLTMYRKSRLPPEAKKDTSPTERPNETLKLTDQFLALLLLVLVKAGLLDALTGMLEEVATGTNLSRKAILLMAEMLQMANRVLPLSIAADIQV